jgi:hypothetical protein
VSSAVIVVMKREASEARRMVVKDFILLKLGLEVWKLR